MAKLSNKKILDLLESIKWDADEFDPENGKFDEVFYTDRNFFKYALMTNGGVLQYASDEFKSDKDLIKLAYEADGSSSALRYASDELKSDKDFILELVQIAGTHVISDASDALFDMEFINLFDPKDLDFLIEDRFDLIKENKPLVLNILSSNGYSFRYLPDDWKNDFEVAKAACEHNSNAYEHISDELKGNRELLLAAISQQFGSAGEALMHASDELKADRDIAKIAVRSYGASLCCLSDTLKNDKEIIKLALYSRSQLSEALPCIPDELLSDREFAKELMCIEGDIYDYLDDSLKKEDEFKLLKKIKEI